MPFTHTFDTGELVVSYAEGPATGPPLLFLHGLLGRWQSVERVMEALSDRWHVYACDLRGHGESGRAPTPGAYRLKDYLRDIEVFIREGIPDERQVALIGFSLGAMVALGTASALPDKISGILLIDPPLMLRTHRLREMPIARMFGIAYETTRHPRDFDDLMTTCRAVMPDAEEDLILETATQLSKIDPDVTNPDLLDGLLHGVDLTAMLAAYRGPIMLLHGEPALGSLVNRGDVAWMRHYAPNAEIVPIPGAGHGTPPELVLEHGRRFLNTL